MALKILFVLFFVLSVLVCASLAEKEPAPAVVPVKNCKVGQSYFNGCNTCTCDGPNNQISCTRRLCPGNPDTVAPPPEFWEESLLKSATSEPNSVANVQLFTNFIGIFIVALYISQKI